MKTIEVFLIRHGRTPGNEERRYVGRTDESLSEEGVREVKALRDAGVLPPVDLVFSSPMKRCLETAGILFPETQKIIIDEFCEIDFGDFEGHNAGELLSDFHSGYQEWIDSGGTMTFPNGEPRDAFIERCRRGFGTMMNLCGGEKYTVAAIVHGGTIMSILSGLCGGDYYDYMCGNAEGYRFVVRSSADGWTVEGLTGKVISS